MESAETPQPSSCIDPGEPGKPGEPRAEHPASLPERDLLAQCQMEFLRRAGPGGQHRNKVETAVRLVHRPTGITAEASERRSQADNRRQALQRLRVAMAIELRTQRCGTASPLWRERLRHGPLRVNRDHADFPVLLAEALDWLAQHHFQPAQAAIPLECTPSQIVRLCRLSATAWRWLNDQRHLRGLHPLR